MQECGVLLRLCKTATWPWMIEHWRQDSSIVFILRGDLWRSIKTEKSRGIEHTLQFSGAKGWNATWRLYNLWVDKLIKAAFNQSSVGLELLLGSKSILYFPWCSEVASTAEKTPAIWSAANTGSLQLEFFRTYCYFIPNICSDSQISPQNTLRY